MSEGTQLSLFKGKRQRGEGVPPPREFAIHCALADMIRRWIMPGWVWTHFPAGEARPAVSYAGRRVSITGFRLKRMGLNPGFPDFQFFSVEGPCAFLELKRQGQKLSDEQQEIAEALIAAGHLYLVTDDFKEAVERLTAWGVLRAGVAVQ